MVASKEHSFNFPQLAEFSEGNFEIKAKRTDAWRNMGFAGRADLGRAVTIEAIEFCDARQLPPSNERVLILATQVAIEHPPLLGTELAQFIDGAQEVISTREEA